MTSKWQHVGHDVILKLAWFYNVYQSCHEVWCKFIICDICPMSQCRCPHSSCLSTDTYELESWWPVEMTIVHVDICSKVWVKKNSLVTLRMFSLHKSLTITLPVQLINLLVCIISRWGVHVCVPVWGQLSFLGFARNWEMLKKLQRPPVAD